MSGGFRTFLNEWRFLKRLRARYGPLPHELPPLILKCTFYRHSSIDEYGAEQRLGAALVRSRTCCPPWRRRPEMSGGFPNISRRVAVFEAPLGQIRPDSARFTATHFKMHVLPPLVNEKSRPERHPQAPYPHRRARPPGRHPSDDPTGPHTRRSHPQAARACRLPRFCHRQAPQCDRAPPPWKGGAPQQSRCARA